MPAHWTRTIVRGDDGRHVALRHIIALVLALQSCAEHEPRATESPPLIMSTARRCLPGIVGLVSTNTRTKMWGATGLAELQWDIYHEMPYPSFTTRWNQVCPHHACRSEDFKWRAGSGGAANHCKTSEATGTATPSLCHPWGCCSAGAQWAAASSGRALAPGSAPEASD